MLYRPNPKPSLKLAFSLIEISIVILILGILITGVSRGIDLYDDYKLQIAKNLTKNSIVGRLNDLYLWFETSLDESFEKNIKENSKIVSSWNNINPRATEKIFLKQENQNKAPIYIEKGINDLPTLKFDFVNNQCKILVLNNFNLSINQTYFIVFRTSISGGVIITANDNKPPNLLIQTQSEGATWPTASSRLMRFSISTGVIQDAVENTYYSTIKVNDETNYVFGSVRNADNNYFIMQLNGNGNIVSKSLEKRDLLNKTLYIGALRDCSITSSDIRQFVGYVSEIIIFDRALNDKEFRDVTKYLITKYAI